jgi:hypothetical protein
MRHHRPRPPNFPGEHSHADLRDLTLTFAPIAIFVVVVITLVIWLVDPAPPHTITMSAGPHDSSFILAANEYKKILARNGVTLKVLESDGSLQNLQRLLDPNSMWISHWCKAASRMASPHRA